MFENLIRQVQAVTAVTGHLSGQAKSMFRTSLMGGVSAPFLGVQILLGDVSRLITLLDVLPDTYEFSAHLELAEDYSMAQDQRRLELYADELQGECYEIEDRIKEIDVALNLLNVEMAQLSHLMLELRHLSEHSDKESEGVSQTVQLISERVFPDVMRLEHQMQDIRTEYENQLGLREDRIHHLNQSVKYQIGLMRDVKEKATGWSKRLTDDAEEDNADAGDAEDEGEASAAEVAESEADASGVDDESEGSESDADESESAEPESDEPEPEALDSE